MIGMNRAMFLRGGVFEEDLSFCFVLRNTKGWCFWGRIKGGRGVLISVLRRIKFKRVVFLRRIKGGGLEWRGTGCYYC